MRVSEWPQILRGDFGFWGFVFFFFCSQPPLRTKATESISFASCCRVSPFMCPFPQFVSDLASQPVEAHMSLHQPLCVLTLQVTQVCTCPQGIQWLQSHLIPDILLLPFCRLVHSLKMTFCCHVLFLHQSKIFIPERSKQSHGQKKKCNERFL